MIVLGVILLIVGWAVSMSIVSTLGLVLVLVGVVLALAGGFGHPIAGRGWWW